MARPNEEKRRPTVARYGGRRAFTLALGLALLVLVYVQMSDFEGAGDFSTAIDTSLTDTMLPGERGEERFRSLSASDERLLRRQRDLVDDLARRNVGTELTGHALDDLRVLQEILDRNAVAEDETFALQSLGVALGDVMAAQLGLHWVVIVDELGRSRALRKGQTETLVFPITMISKRVERDLEVDVGALYAKTARSVTGSGARP